MTGRLFEKLFIGGLAGFACLICALSWAIIKTTHASTETVLAEYDRMRSVAAFEDKIDTWVSANTPALMTRQPLKGGTSAEVSAEILMLLSRQPAAANVQVLRSAELPARKLGSATLAGQSVELTGTWPAILGLLAAIESLPSAMVVDSFAIHAPLDGIGNSEEEPVYSVELQLFALAELPQPAAATSPK